MAEDLDKSGPAKNATNVYLGPSLGWTTAPQNITTVTQTGITLIDRNTTWVEVNCNAVVTIQLPSVSIIGSILGTIVGSPVTILDIGGFATAHNITILPYGSETIMGLGLLTISTNYGSYTIKPVSSISGWGVIAS